MVRLLRFGPKEPVRTDRVDPLRALAASARGGSEEAQRTLLIEVGPSMLRVVRAILGTAYPDVEDALQESLAALFVALSGFRGECSVRHFACQVAVRTALNIRRQRNARRHVVLATDDELDDLQSEQPSPAERAAAQRRRDRLRELLCELPEIHSDVLALHVMLGFTVEETASALRVPANTVRSRLRAALSSLREAIRENRAALELLGGQS